MTAALSCGVAPRPGARFHLEEIAVGGRIQQAIEVHVELDAPVGDEPSPAILLDLLLACRLEVLAIEARRVRRRCEKAGTKQQHGPESPHARRTGQRQPRAGVDHLILRHRGIRLRGIAAGPARDRGRRSRCRTGDSAPARMIVTSSLSSARRTESSDVRRALTWISKLSCSAAPPIATSFCSTLCSRSIEE